MNPRSNSGLFTAFNEPFKTSPAFKSGVRKQLCREEAERGAVSSQLVTAAPRGRRRASLSAEDAGARIHFRARWSNVVHRRIQVTEQLHG